MTSILAPSPLPSSGQAIRPPFALALSLILLNLADTAATLHLVAKGAQEANPLLVILLLFPLLFVLAKTVGVTVLALGLLLVRARKALWIGVSAYVGVCLVHCWMLALAITK